MFTQHVADSLMVFGVGAELDGVSRNWLFVFAHVGFAIVSQVLVNRVNALDVDLALPTRKKVNTPLVWWKAQSPTGSYSELSLKIRYILCSEFSETTPSNSPWEIVLSTIPAGCSPALATI